MTTTWLSPSLITPLQVDEYDHPWVISDTGVYLCGPLNTHFNSLASAMSRSNTYALVCTGFNFPQTPVNGVELFLDNNRNGRVLDYTISLWDGELIGKDKVNWHGTSHEDFISDCSNEMYYGGATDTWGVDFTQVDITNPNFGVYLRFQSHIFFPHNDSILLNSIRLRIH